LTTISAPPLHAPRASAADPDRLAALRRTGLAGAPDDGAFDGWARRAASLLDAPAAFVALVDGERDFHLARAGVDGPRELGGCTLALQAMHSALAVGDTRGEHEGAAEAAELGARAFLGAPVRATTGEPIGALCVIGWAERAWTPRDAELLEALAEGVSAEIGKRTLGSARDAIATLVQNLAGMVYRVRNDSSMTLEFVSDAARELTGYSAAELSRQGGNGFVELIHPDDRERADDEVRRALAVGPRYETTYRIVTADGAERWVREQGQRLGEGEGAIREGLIIDVTERKEAQLALEATERRLRAVVEQAPLILWVMAADGTVTFSEGRSLPTVGLNPGEMVGRNMLQVYAGRPRELERIRRALAGETLAYTVADESYAIEVRYSPVFDDAGRFVYTIGLGVDVSDVERARAELRRTTGRLEAVVRTQQEVALAELEPEVVMKLVTERVMELTGADGAVVEMVVGDDIVYSSASGAFAPHVGKRLRVSASLSGLCTRTGEVQRSDDVLSDPRVDGVMAAMVGARSMMIAPLRTSGGAPMGTLKVVSPRVAAFGESDKRTLQLVAGLIGETLGRAEQFRAKRALVAELERSNRELEQFAYVASHDLQEPLRMVASYVQLLEHRHAARLDDEAREFIGFAVDGARRMQRLIHDLLTYSRVGTRGGAAAPVRLERVMERVEADLALVIGESGAVVTHDPLPEVAGDEGQLAQLFQNLVSNAVKFRRPGVPPRIHVAAAPHGGGWSFTVDDNGIGIEPEYGERVFALFQRLHRREDYDGTGIGLALCKKIVERHGGRIGVEPGPGGTGSRIRFTLNAGERP
jgi:PAS domain S-box-containing protein